MKNQKRSIISNFEIKGLTSIFFNNSKNFIFILFCIGYLSPQMLKACHNESDTWTSVINNGNGTYIINFQSCVEATCERSSGIRFTVGGATIINVISPSSLNGNVGTIFPGTPAGSVVDYGTPFVNTTLWITNTGGCSQICYNFSFLVSGLPTSISHSGTEYTNGFCTTAPITAPAPIFLVPTLGEWGMIIFPLSLLSIGSILFFQRKRQLRILMA